MGYLIGLLGALGLPLFAALAAAALLGYWRAGVDPLLLGMDFTRVVALPELAALPLFIFAGVLILHRQDGTGSGAVSPAADSKVPEPDATAVGLVAPSVPLIIYALSAGLLAPRLQLELTGLYLQALVPLGLVMLLGASLAGFGYGPLGRTLPGRSRARALRAWARDWPLLPIVIGGLYSGWLPLVDAAVVTVVWLLVSRVALQGRVALGELPKLMGDAMVRAAALCLLLGLSVAAASALNDTGVAQYGLKWSGSTLSGLALLVFVVALLVLAGTVLDVLTGMALLAPIVIVLAAGSASRFDPAGLGVLCVLGLQLGRGLVWSAEAMPRAPLGSAVEAPFAPMHWCVALTALLSWLAWLMATSI